MGLSSKVFLLNKQEYESSLCGWQRQISSLTQMNMSFPAGLNRIDFLQNEQEHEIFLWG